MATGFEFRLAQNVHDMHLVSVVRAAAFLGHGREEPYEEEFDGRDFNLAAHILAVRAEDPNIPMATFRIWVANGGIEWGRLAILPAERGNRRLLSKLADEAKRITLEAGFSEATGYVNDKSLQKFWARRGAQIYPEAEEYGGRLYYKMIIPL